MKITSPKKRLSSGIEVLDRRCPVMRVRSDYCRLEQGRIEPGEECRYRFRPAECRLHPLDTSLQRERRPREAPCLERRHTGRVLPDLLADLPCQPLLLGEKL